MPEILKSVEPAPLYYLHNYRTLLTWVRSRYGDLLTDEERSYAEQFLQLPESAQALLTRLITRKGEYFRVSKLAYKEIPDISAALHQLKHLGWLELNPMLSIGEIFGRLTRPELTAWLGKYTGTKAAWLSELEQVQSEILTWDQWFSGAFSKLPKSDSLAGDLVAVTIMPMSDVYSLLFFGNHYQALSEFVLADLGIFQYEQVEFSERCRSFTHRTDLDAYRQLQHTRERFDADGDVSSALANLPSPSQLPTWLAHRVDRFRFQLGYKQEQLGNFDQALVIYTHCCFSEARGRRIRVLEKQGRKLEALALLNAAWASPHTEAELQQLSRARPRLQKAVGLSCEKPVGFSAASHALTLPCDDTRVEQAVAAYYHSPHEPCCWVENHLWTGLFGLCFWPAIYAPVPGAFFNPFQSRPKDLYHRDFAASREAILRECWQLLDARDYKFVLRQRYRDKQGLQSPLVNWSQFSEALLDLALVCITTVQLKAIFTRMIFDIKANCSGFPDLIQFMPAQQRFKLIEVKGPGDKLQDNQLRWLAFFEGQGIEAEVCYVQWAQS